MREPLRLDLTRVEAVPVPTGPRGLAARHRATQEAYRELWEMLYTNSDQNSATHLPVPADPQERRLLTNRLREYLRKRARAQGLNFHGVATEDGRGWVMWLAQPAPEDADQQ